MRLKVLSSGSVGNCYILENAEEALIIECGVSFSKVKQALDFKLNKVVGALLTHEHQDHAREVNTFAASGINVYASAGTIEVVANKLHLHRFKAVAAFTKFTIGGFTVTPFDVKHDCREPFGFIISHAETGNVLFITDSYFVKYTFPNLNNIIVEANYCMEVLSARYSAGAIHAKVRDRVLKSHMSLETTKNLLLANDLTGVNNIVLIHLSDGNSDEGKFIKEVGALTGKSVFVAKKDMEIEFNRTPFTW